jgi:two-component system, chemotaxis family, chemotaxis protein CheY
VRDDGRWILVVDDDDSIRELLAIILESRGFEVETAVDGQEALDRLHSRDGRTPPALVLLDLMMPGMDGITFVDEIRKDASYASVPVVVISGDQRATRRLERAKVDVQECMIKPIELDALLHTVHHYAQ